MEGVLASFVVFRTAEVPQHVGVPPARLIPLVVVALVTSDICHPIDGASSTDDPSLRKVHASGITGSLRLSAEIPVVAGLEKLSPGDRDSKLVVEVVVPSFYQRYRHGGVCAQTVRQHTPRRASAHEHEAGHSDDARPSPCTGLLLPCGHHDHDPTDRPNDKTLSDRLAHNVWRNWIRPQQVG